MAEYERGDQAVAEMWDALRPDGVRSTRSLLRRPRVLREGLRGIGQLPVLTISPGGGRSGEAFRAALLSSRRRQAGFRLLGAAVLQLPETAGDYLEGRRQQTARRMIRKAGRAGLSTRAVAPEERAELLALANAREARHEDPLYRNTRPDNADLLDHDLWRLTVDGDGLPLLLAVIPVDGEWGLLRYFRRLNDSPVHTLARWWASYDVVQELVGRKVRYLLDSDHPAAQSNGNRHFQRMLGFRYARVRLSRAG